MKNKFTAIGFFALCCFFGIKSDVNAQQNSISLNKKGISVYFKIETSSPRTSKVNFNSVYFTGYEDAEKESRIHRVLGDRASGAYFGYDLIIESGDAPNKFRVSVKPLSIMPPERLRLNDLTAHALPKYPADLMIEDGDTIALDLLVNQQTKVKIVDLIKITAKRPSAADSFGFGAATGGAGFNPSASSGGFGASAGGGFNKQPARDFTPNDVKLRLTVPKLLVNGAASPARGADWNGSIEGSIIYIYVPEKGRFVFSLFQRDGFDFSKAGVVENDKINFQANGDSYELVSAAPIVSGGGNWTLWVLSDTDYQPDATFGAASADHIQYGAADAVEFLLSRKPPQNRRARIESARNVTGNSLQKWLEDDVRYIVTDAEKQAFAGLNTDEERERFIESFWKRRDDKPETKENEFRREYYNRFAYANQNFAAGKTAGWLTDRGRIFITRGKPSEIRKNAAGETWFYQSENGESVEFEFKADGNGGDLRLQQ